MKDNEQNKLWDRTNYKDLCLQLARLTKLGLRLLIQTSNDKEAIKWAESCMISLEECFPVLGNSKDVC